MFFRYPIFITEKKPISIVDINSQSNIHDKLFFLGTAHMTRQSSLQTIVKQSSTQHKMVAIKQCIQLLVHVKISVDISVQFQKIPISDIANFTISAANILAIRYISQYLLLTAVAATIQKPGQVSNGNISIIYDATQ